MKYILTFLIALSLSAASFGQTKPVVTINSDGSITVKKDTVIVERVIVRDTIIYRDRIVVKDSIVYVEKVVTVEKIVYVDRPVLVYRDTCGGRDTVIVPPVGKVDYMNLPIVGPQDFSGRSNQVFENKRIVNAPGVAFKLYNGANNITIRNCFFDGAAGILVELENARNITIENCLFAKGWSGVYSLASSGIKIVNCQFVNMKIRRKSDGSFNGLGNFMQFNSSGDIQVLNCKGENFPEADPEDMISFFKSSNGVVKGNIFRGNPTTLWSTSGGGIIAGDNGGDNVVLSDNTLMTSGNYGMAIAGGTRMKILNNKIYSERNAISNNPLYVWAQAGAACSDVTVTGNRVYWIDKNGSRNNGWNAGNCSNTIFEAPTPITFAEMNVPTHLIDFVSPTDLLKIRGK